MSPKWPPIPVVISGGIKPTVGHLLRPITEKFPDLLPENTVIYKYNNTKHEWELLRIPPVKTANTNAKNIIKANEKTMESIKESDLLCVFSSNDVLPSGGTSSSQLSLSELLPTIQISLPEDLFLQKMKQELNQQNVKLGKNTNKNKMMKQVQFLNSHLQNKMNSKDGGYSKLKRKEYTLEIRTHDSSDEEEEEEEERKN
jgi:hypothetical protein